MSKRNKGKNQNVMDWLNEVVKADPKAQEAYEDERLRLGVANALREAREFTGMTQAMVAEALGVPQSQISRLEKPDHNHTVETIRAYLNAVGAGLIMAVINEDKHTLIPASDLAENVVFLPNEVKAKANAKSLTLREYILSCVSEENTKHEMIKVMWSELYEHMNVWSSHPPQSSNTLLEQLPAYIKGFDTVKYNYARAA